MDQRFHHSRLDTRRHPRLAGRLARTVRAIAVTAAGAAPDQLDVSLRQRARQRQLQTLLAECLSITGRWGHRRRRQRSNRHGFEVRRAVCSRAYIIVCIPMLFVYMYIPCSTYVNAKVGPCWHCINNTLVEEDVC